MQWLHFKNQAVTVLAAIALLAACESPTSNVGCTEEARRPLFVEVTRPAGGGAIEPAAGVQVELVPNQPDECYQIARASTNAQGMARLEGMSHRRQWTLHITPPAGFGVVNSVIPVADTDDTLRVGLHFTPQDTVVTLYVADYMVDCVGAGPMRCLRVRYREQDPYQLFYDPIEGFTFDAGFEYTLRVTRRRVPVPMADQGLYTYHLVEMVAKRYTSGGLSAAMSLFLQQVPDQITQAILHNQDLLPRNPNSAAQIQAKIALLQTPGLAQRVVNLSLHSERSVPSMDGRTIPIVTIFTADSMRYGAFASINYLVRALPILEGFMETPFPMPSVRVWYGFTLGNSGGGGLINMEDRGTYESRTPPTRLPHDAILAHELAHSYIGNEALTQFLELYVDNVMRSNSRDIATWTHLRAYVQDQAGNEGVHALLDIYRLIGWERMMAGYRAVYPLRPPYGSPLSAAVRQAFVDAVWPEHRAIVAAKLATITF